MKYFICYAVVILLFALAASPIVVVAQTADWERDYHHQPSDLQQKINALGDTANASVKIPVLFGVGVKNISSNFGVPRDGGARTHEGEDIMIIKGTPIVSPTPAVVTHTSTDIGSSEGNAVYTANPGGETFVYYHLDRIGEGVVSGLVLKQGSLIGYVGNTGNASGGAAHLHFEIHNSSGTPTDPFPRLTGEFSLQEKMSYLSIILTQASDTTAFLKFLVLNFRSTFVAALAANVPVPVLINDLVNPIPVTPKPVGTSLSVGDLTIGSSGTAVVTLQKYLIKAASGVAATHLANVGATGYFGVITKAALMEYQVAIGISPADGYYGSATRVFIVNHPFVTPLPPITTTLTRNLYRSISGEDVRTLQKLLNANGYTVALIGAGSLGNETNYFGPATEAAVIKFQIAHGILPATGYVGLSTRIALESL